MPEDEKKRWSAELFKQISKQETAARTTFALTKDGEAALDWIREHSKKSIKSVIDSLCEQLQQTLTDEKEGILGKFIIEDLAQEKPKSSAEKFRRSMVLSKKSLKILKDVEKKYQISRDALLDSGFCLVMKIMENSKETRLENHKRALSLINKLQKVAAIIETRLKELLDDEDPVLIRLGVPIQHLMNLIDDLEKEQNDGTPINPD